MKFHSPFTVLFCLLYLCQPLAAQDQIWQTVSIPGICTFQIPPSVEIQKGIYKKINDKSRETILEIVTSPDRVVAQPKGINSLNAQALKLYCRIIVETDWGKRGEYRSLDVPLVLSGVDLRKIDVILKQEILKAAAFSTSKGIKMTITSWQPTEVVKINGADALHTTYTRKINDAPPVIVNTFMVMNNDLLHRIIISYRIEEEDMWKNDLTKVPGTFKFVKR